MAKVKAKRKDVLRLRKRRSVIINRISDDKFNTFGDSLYYIGTMVERNYKLVTRSLKNGSWRTAKGLFRVVAMLFSYTIKVISGAWNDVTLPFRKMRRSFKELSKTIKKDNKYGTKFTFEKFKLYLKHSYLWNRYLISRLLNYILPIASLAVCVLVINTMLGLNYAIEVNYNGETIGYVQDEVVYDSARQIIQGRMFDGDDQSFLREETQLKIAVVDDSELVSQSTMADNLLNASGSVKNASGVYIGGVFYGATSAPDLLKDSIDNILNPMVVAASEIGDGVTAKFAREVNYEPGVYPIESILPLDELIDIVTSKEERDIYYTAKADDSITEIAAKNGITVDRLKDMNPGIDFSSFPSGTKMLVAESEVLLRTKITRMERRTEQIPFQIQRIIDPNMPKGSVVEIVAGRIGERTIIKEIEFDVDGNKLGELVLSNTQTTAPIDKVIKTGPGGSGGDSMGSGVLEWPTGPGWKYVRGFNPSISHYGVDLSIPLNSPIYAADSGVITIADWYSNYGITIMINHNNGMQTLYGHNNVPLVEVGDIVNKGDLIALSGSTGKSTGPHLHFEVYLNGSRVDPMPYIG